MSKEVQKIPKAAYNPELKKEVKVKQEPQNYLSQYVSWQLGSIDFESDWHAHLLNSRFIFTINDEVQKLLVDLSETDINSAASIEKILLEIKNKEFKTAEEFFHIINYKTGCEVPNNIITALSRQVKDFYFWREIFPKMKALETMTWNDVKNATHGRNNKSNSHEISLKDLNKDAQRRIEALKLDNIGSVYSLRIGGTLRIFGIRQMGYLRILWFDENHEVCPQDIQAKGKNFS